MEVLMGKIILTKVEMAVKQLKTAINLFIEKQDYICSITLAGAAEEILGKLVSRAGKTTAYETLCNALQGKYDPGIKKEELDKHLNNARNTLKHARSIKENRIELEPLPEAISMIARAIHNLIVLNNTETYNAPNTTEFLSWINKHWNEWIIKHLNELFTQE